MERTVRIKNVCSDTTLMRAGKVLLFSLGIEFSLDINHIYDETYVIQLQDSSQVCQIIDLKIFQFTGSLQGAITFERADSERNQSIYCCSNFIPFRVLLEHKRRVYFRTYPEINSINMMLAILNRRFKKVRYVDIDSLYTPNVESFFMILDDPRTYMAIKEIDKTVIHFREWSFEIEFFKTNLDKLFGIPSGRDIIAYGASSVGVDMFTGKPSRKRAIRSKIGKYNLKSSANNHRGGDNVRLNKKKKINTTD